MARTQKFTLRLSSAEKQRLLELARREERAPSDLLRRLIRQAARQGGFTIEGTQREQEKPGFSTLR